MLANKVKDWMTKTGFPLEMSVASAFRKSGFEIRQSLSYLDELTKKGREIDVLAVDPDPIGIIDIAFVMECKASKKPWVVLTSEDTLSGVSRVHTFAITSSYSKEILIKRALESTLGKISKLMHLPSHGGYDFRQALGGNNDPAYSAAIGVIKACLGFNQLSVGKLEKKLTFYFPVIVVDSPLFECYLNKSDEIQLKEVKETKFLFNGYLPDNTTTNITVVHKSQLEKFGIKARELATVLRSELEQEQNELFNKLKLSLI